MALTLRVDDARNRMRFQNLPVKERREMLEFETAFFNYWHKELERLYPKLYGKKPFAELFRQHLRKLSLGRKHETESARRHSG